MFLIDNILEKDSVFLCDLKLCQVRLMNNSNFPWVVLVPRLSGLVEFTDLTDGQQNALCREISHISRNLEVIFSPHKVNVAMLGNIVRQLHVHIVARFEGDSAWPEPVFGTPAKPYSEKALAMMVEALKPITNSMK
jgi:diadenosine tetraphosphate (Ap4A) HIT family hydrolase